MPSQFFGLTIASSALSSFQASVNTTANNISNVKTVGYSRQEAVLKAADALRVHQRYGTAGSGVEVTNIKRVRDEYYDVKYWESNARYGYFDNKLYYAQQVEDYILDDDAVKGFNTIMDEMFNALDTLQQSAADRDKRAQFISKSRNLVNYFVGVSNGYSKIQDTCNQEISTVVEEINSIGAEIALLNKEINIIELQGGYANELRDERTVLLDRLSNFVSVESAEVEISNSNYPDTYLGGTEFTVKINGQTLVKGNKYNELICVARDYKVNQSDNDGLYDVVWKATNNQLATTGITSDGSLMALFETRDGNNMENFKATVSATEAVGETTIVTLKEASITDIKLMTMNGEGVIHINNKPFKYKSFSYDADTQTYQFVLEEKLNLLEQSKLMNKTAEIGTSIDAMGIPYYMSQLNTFLRSFAEEFNNIHRTGVDAHGKDADSFFVAINPHNGSEYNFDEYDADGSMRSNGNNYYQLTAQSLEVAAALAKDPTLMATVTKDAYNPDDVDKYDLVLDLMKLKSDIDIFRGGSADQFLECLITDNSVDTQKAQIFYTNFQNITETVDKRRMSISGVDEDEEALNLVKFQNAYNLSSRMVQTMSEMYDRLILETGV